MPEEATGTATDTLEPQTETAETGTESSLTYTIAVGDEQREVTLDELRSGYMRQADYTRKTQDLANQRGELENALLIDQAFRNDPRAATMAMAEFYGFTPMGSAEPSGDQWDNDEVDPAIARELAELKAQVRSLSTNQSQQSLDREAQELVDRYPGVDPQEVKRHALANRIPTLELAARDLLYDDRDEAWQAVQARKQADQEVIERKKQAGVVSPGTGPASGSVNEPAADNSGKSFRELFAETVKEANANLDDLF